jgi:hypothetical protein
MLGKVNKSQIECPTLPNAGVEAVARARLNNATAKANKRHGHKWWSPTTTTSIVGGSRQHRQQHGLHLADDRAHDRGPTRPNLAVSSLGPHQHHGFVAHQPLTGGGHHPKQRHHLKDHRHSEHLVTERRHRWLQPLLGAGGHHVDERLAPPGIILPPYRTL